MASQVTQNSGAKLYGKPTTLPFVLRQVESNVVDSPGGGVILATAGASLKYGDLVYWTLGGRVDKTLNASWYHARFAGVVVGGSLTDYQASTDSGLIGSVMSTVGQLVVLQVDGIAFVANDAAGGFTYYGQNVVSGQTTAGRALALDANLGSYITSDPDFAIHGAASAVGKVFSATNVIISGASGTAVAVADTAALSGTVTNATYNIFEARSTGSTNQTTAMGTAGASLALVTLPAAPAVGVATYGVIIVHPSGVGDFVGGTTALDDATVIPNAVFVSLISKYKSIGSIIDTGAATVGTAFRMRIYPSA